MDLSIQSLEQTTSPIEVVNLLGKDLYKCDQGNYTTKCPKCESKLYILDKEFVCENSNCTFRGGSVCDYLVAGSHCKWDQVIDTLNTILDGRLNNTSIIRNKKAIISSLQNKRKLFDFFLRVGLKGSINNMACLQYKSAIRSQGIDPDMLRWSVFIIGGEDVNLLKTIINNTGDKRDFNFNNSCIVLPYFSDYHTISHLLVLNTPSSRPEKIAVNPHRTSFFGLLQRHPNAKVTKLAYTYADAAKLNTQYGRMSPENICLHMLIDATANGNSFSLPNAEYVITEENNDDFRAVAMTQKYVAALKVDNSQTDIYKENNTIPSSRFIVDCLIKSLRKGINISSLLELAGLTTSNKQELLTRLHQERFFDAADEVRNFFKTLPIYTDDKITLFSNPFGYTLKKNTKETHITYVSNFILELEQNVVFAESTDIFHAGSIIFDGNTYPVMLKQDELDRPVDLEKAVRRATLGSPGEGENNLPTIKERGAAKYLTNYLRDNISSLPRTEGLPILGWSPRRTSFYTPYFISDKKGTRVGKKYFHPTNQALVNFTTDISEVSQLHTDLPEDVFHIINQAATFITRSFLSMPVRPITLYNDTESRTLLSGLFAGLGQISVAQLNHNIRGEDSPGLRGFPHYAVGYTSGQANKSSLPAFIMCDSGVKVECIYSQDIIEQGRRTLKYVVQKVAEWAIKTDAANFSQAHSVSRTNAYSIEGSNVIIDACGLTSWPSSQTPFENLDSMLSSIRFDEVKQYFIKDINRHVMQISREALTSVKDIPGLERELQVISKQVQFTDTSLDVDAEAMMDALNTYYHTSPIVTEVFNADALLSKVIP
jgi:hypothetical protein